MNGMEVVIDWPAPPMRPWSLATETYRPLDALLPNDDNPLRWLSGVTWRPYGCPDTTAKVLDDECATTDQIFSDPSAFESFVTMKAFRIESAFECSSLGGMGVNGEELYKHALEVTEQDRSRQLARQVMFGLPVTANIDLTDQADIVTTPDTSPFGALAAVENGLATRLNNGYGMIHMSPGMLTYLASGGGFTLVDGQWHTPTGHCVVADAGYVGAGGQAGQDWVYGSGEVYYIASPLQPVSSSWENFDWENNVVEAQVEQYMLAVFEPCAVVAARSDIALSPVGI